MEGFPSDKSVNGDFPHSFPSFPYAQYPIRNKASDLDKPILFFPSYPEMFLLILLAFILSFSVLSYSVVEGNPVAENGFLLLFVYTLAVILPAVLAIFHISYKPIGQTVKNGRESIGERKR